MGTGLCFGGNKNIMDQIGKAVRQGCIFSHCLFNLYVEYGMQNARLDEAQARVRILPSPLWQKVNKN